MVLINKGGRPKTAPKTQSNKTQTNSLYLILYILILPLHSLYA